MHLTVRVGAIAFQCGEIVASHLCLLNLLNVRMQLSHRY